MTHDTHPIPPLHTHTHPTPNLGGCEEDLSKKTAPDGTNRQTNTQTDGHGDSLTDPAQKGQVSKNGRFQAFFKTSSLKFLQCLYIFWSSSIQFVCFFVKKMLGQHFTNKLVTSFKWHFI